MCFYALFCLWVIGSFTVRKTAFEDQFEQLKAFIDIGDILGASGSVKKTEKGSL
jgi:lysyl-tRNA synthetase class II